MAIFLTCVRLIINGTVTAATKGCSKTIPLPHNHNYYDSDNDPRSDFNSGAAFSNGSA